MSERSPRFTLAQWFLASGLALALVVGTTFYALFESSRRTLLSFSDELRDAATLRMEAALSSELGVGATAVDEVARATHFGVVPIADQDAVEARLFAELLDHPSLSDIALTHAKRVGYAAGGSAILEPGDRWQIAVYRQSPDAGSEIFTRRTVQEGGRFVTYVRRRPRDGAFLSAGLDREGVAPDPTNHPTFEVTASEAIHGRAIWSDLSYSELDASLPPNDRRVVLTVQQALEDAPGRFAGVLRAGLRRETIDELPHLGNVGADDATRVFLCDSQGRLVTRVNARDQLQLFGDDLRVASQDASAPVVAALALPALHEVSRTRPVLSEALIADGARYLVTFRMLKNSQEWIAGVVVPEDYYTRPLRALRDRARVALLLTLALVLVGGGYALTRVRRALGRVVATTAQMRRFDFRPAVTGAPFRDIAEVMAGVERAKTSMRGLVKYVPMDLVRQLYEANREPQLGGELLEISLMFSDIEGFTTLSEQLSPDVLARVLGYYLEAMTSGVRSTDGSVDKFIGDSVMAFWNAPSPMPDHARRAADAVLACLRETKDLYASPKWQGLPPLFTRFGLHTARAMVGHFGAPERLSYTALGDGVNLASRLEGLCKHYGVAVLASEAFVTAAGEEFAFRLLDKVAVKGKEQAVRVYELLGRRTECAEALASSAGYQEALDAYFARQFERALGVLETRKDDPASRALAARCKAMIADPPPLDWNGTFVATSK
jgi:adenylate cyclase